MPVRRLNHAGLHVRDVEVSAAFYREVPGFRPIPIAEGLRGAAFLQAEASDDDHDLALFEVRGTPTPGVPEGHDHRPA